jgi:ankyrin repeat protein
MASFGLNNNTTTDASNDAITDPSTPFLAASEGNLPLLQSSLINNQQSSVTSIRDENGYTLLHAASSYNQLHIIRFLLSSINNNSDLVEYIHVGDNEGDTVLHYASTADVARTLIEEYTMNPSVKNKEGKTPLETKTEELNELLQDEDIDEEDDEDVETLKKLIDYLSSVVGNV